MNFKSAVSVFMDNSNVDTIIYLSFYGSSGLLFFFFFFLQLRTTGKWGRENGEDTQHRFAGWDLNLQLLLEDRSLCVWAPASTIELPSCFGKGTMTQYRYLW